ncbi:MAG TPA: hypothetical protein VF079_09665 [Sphingomicrobium sp.]
MTMIDGPTGFVIFRDPWGPARKPEPIEPANDLPADYWRARELAERAAAKRATTAKARSVHQELAQHYARRAASVSRSSRS